MNDIALPPGCETHIGWGGSPVLDGYRGSGSDSSRGRNHAPSRDGAPSTQQRAMADIMQAGQTPSPQRRTQLLRQALALLEPNGGADPAQQPTPSSAPLPQNTATPAPMATLTSDTKPADPPADGSQPGAGGGLTRSGNDSVKTPEYTITASTKNDGSLTVTNNQTKQSFEIWGDPHIKVNGHNIAQFQKDDLNIQLQDGTVIHIQPTATNSKGKSHIAQVSITLGNEAVTMGGRGANGFAGGVSTSGVMQDGRTQSGLYNTPTATDITLGADGDLYYNNANGSMGAEITPNAKGGQTDLDGAGGGLVGDPSTTTTTAATTASSQNDQSLESQLIAILARGPETIYSITMMQELSHMLSQSNSQAA